MLQAALLAGAAASSMPGGAATPAAAATFANWGGASWLPPLPPPPPPPPPVSPGPAVGDAPVLVGRVPGKRRSKKRAFTLEQMRTVLYAVVHQVASGSSPRWAAAGKVAGIKGARTTVARFGKVVLHAADFGHLHLLRPCNYGIFVSSNVTVVGRALK